MLDHHKVNVHKYPKERSKKPDQNDLRFDSHHIKMILAEFGFYLINYGKNSSRKSGMTGFFCSPTPPLFLSLR